MAFNLPAPGQSRLTQPFPPQQARRRRKRILQGTGILVSALWLLGGAAWFGISYLLSLSSYHSLTTEDGDLGIEESELYQDEDGIVLLAFYGVDTKTGEGRSDAIMILVLDSVHNKIKILSIPRDSYVEIPGYGKDKINHAYAYGGPALAIRTLNANFGLDIRHFITLSFESLPKVVDALGGVDLYITAEESPKVPFTQGAGTYHLSGAQAMEFLRIRKIDSDFERTRRHRDLVQALLVKAMDIPSISYPVLLARVMPDLITSLTSRDILSLAALALSLGDPPIEEMRFPEDYLAAGQTIHGGYYYVFDIPTTKAQMMEYIYNDSLTHPPGSPPAAPKEAQPAPEAPATPPEAPAAPPEAQEPAPEPPSEDPPSEP